MPNSVNLGRIAPRYEGPHMTSRAYKRLSIVRDARGDIYITNVDVPANVPLSDGRWHKLVENSAKATIYSY